MKLSEISIYPIKSFGGITLNEAIVEAAGLRFDRRLMLVDRNGRFVTQREHPELARIKVTFGKDGWTLDVEGARHAVPFRPETDKRLEVTVWGSSVAAFEYGEGINAVLSEFVGQERALVWMPDDVKRHVDPTYAFDKSRDIVSFADGFPFLLIGEGSLDDLNSRLEKPVPMNRFRPNLVVSGVEAFAEDEWKQIRIGDTIFHVVKPCARCTIPTIDQITGEKDLKEPLRTLAKYRNRNGGVLFGQNLIVENPGGLVQLGQTVEVIR